MKTYLITVEDHWTQISLAKKLREMLNEHVVVSYPEEIFQKTDKQKRMESARRFLSPSEMNAVYGDNWERELNG